MSLKENKINIIPKIKDKKDTIKIFSKKIKDLNIIEENLNKIGSGKESNE